MSGIGAKEIISWVYKYFSSKIEKEKKQQAKEAGMIRNEVSGAEVCNSLFYNQKGMQRVASPDTTSFVSDLDLWPKN